MKTTEELMEMVDKRYISKSYAESFSNIRKQYKAKGYVTPKQLKFIHNQIKYSKLNKALNN